MKTTKNYIVLNPNNISIARNPIGEFVKQIGEFVFLKFVHGPNIYPYHTSRVSEIKYSVGANRPFYKGLHGEPRVVGEHLLPLLFEETKTQEKQIEENAIESLSVLIQIIDDPSKLNLPGVKHKLEQIRTLIKLYRENYCNEELVKS